MRLHLLPWAPTLRLLAANSRVYPRLMARSNHEDVSKTAVKFGPDFHKIQLLLDNDPKGGWERCWDEGLTPWDLGRATPVLLDLLQRGSLPKGRALVPGCGSGHDVVAMACPERYVVGLDISEVAIRKARELSSSVQNAEYFSFLQEDFFTWKPTELFDLIFDYTFFCAIEPDMRAAWARRMQDLLKPDGELVTLMFPIDDHSGGPPYKTSVTDYEEVLHPMGFQAISVVENELAIETRKPYQWKEKRDQGDMGREKLGRWKRVPGWSAI